METERKNKMNEPIRYRGLSLVKDELAVKNGELALCGGVEIRDGAVRPSVLSGTALAHALTNNDASAPKTVTLKYVHVTTSYTHLIGQLTLTDSANNNAAAYQQLYWYQDNGTFGGLIKQFDDGVSVNNIQSVGNTLIVLASDGLHYILWKNTSNTYKYLGQKPPFVTIQFDISTNKSGDYENGGVTCDSSEAGYWEAFQETSVSCGDMFKTITKSSAYSAGDNCLSINNDEQSAVTEAVWALINRTNNYIAKQGHFYANFFVRYCYRMYDGSMVMHSAPVFMPVLIPNSYKIYVMNAHLSADAKTVGLDDTITVNRNDSSGNKMSFSINKATFMYHPRNVALCYQIIGNSVVAKLQEWSDIIKSIDIFVSAPITKADNSVLIKDCSILSDDYCKEGPWQEVFTYNGTQPVNITADIPGLSNEAFANKIVDVAQFFKIYSFKVTDLKTTADTELPLDKSAIVNLEVQEQMTDDYKTHNNLFPTGAYVYNHRINLFNLNEQLFTGFNDIQLFPYDTTLTEEGLVVAILKIVVRLNTDDGYKYVDVPGANSYLVSVESYALFNLPKFYPDARADRMIIFYQTTGKLNYIAQFDMVACKELNGSFAIGNFSKDYSPTILDSFVYTPDRVVRLPNKVYTSEANNPYYFPVAGINTVGMGIIKGLAAATRALSQGQFGQYPLMAFATDGIWALQVSSTGTYSSIHPISREVCVNPASITQLDQSVVFATDRSLNKVVESSVASFSDILDGPFFNVRTKLPALAALFDSGGKYENTGIQQLIDFSTPPIEYFKGGSVLYDFVNNRLLVIPASASAGDISDGKEVALVYSIRDNAWSTMLIDTPLTALNSYPYPYLQKLDGSVIKMDQKYDYANTAKYAGLIVTRTLSFEGVMKAVEGFSQLGDNNTQGLLVFFGSNDNKSWYYIGRSARDHENYLPAHSYRFFRLALYLQMSQGEKYYQTNLEITDKYQKL